MAISLLKAPNLERIQNLIHGFTTRAGGVSESPYDSLNLGWMTGDEDEVVEANYVRLSTALGLERNRVVGALQDHGSEVAVIRSVGEIDALATTKADALVTDAVGIALTVRVADCLPIIIADPAHHVVGIVHAGWRGTLAKVLPLTISKMTQEFKSDPSDLVVAVGPGIGRCCFEVSHGIASLIQQEVSLTGSEVTEKGRPYLDLAAINRRLAAEAGVRPDAIWLSGVCTKCDAKRFYSFRRDGRESGRSVGVVGWSA